MAFALLAALTLVSGVIFRRIRLNFVDPVIRLNQQLEEPNLRLSPDTFPDGTVVQDLVSKLREKNSQLADDYQEQLITINSTITRLQKRIDQLEDEIDTSQNSLNQLKTSQSLEAAYIQDLTGLCEQPLASTIGHINLLTESTQESLDSAATEILSEISSAAVQIVFLTRELLNYKYSERRESQFDIHQVVDDAITLINPITESRGIQLIPIFDEQARFEFLGNRDLTRALVFNFVFSQLLNRNIEDNQTLILQISFVANRQLTFSLSPLEQSDDSQNTIRLINLVQLAEATLENTLVSVPATPTRIPVKRIHGAMTAHIAVNNYIQQRSIESRLFNLGIEVTDDKNAADICLVGFEQHHEIMEFTNDLRTESHVLLLHNTTLYNQPNWHQLKNPLDHNELIQTVHNLNEEPQRRYQLMVVDDNKSNLRLVTLLLNELGHDVTAIDNPVEAVSIVKKTPFDLVFMDIQMPGITGIKASQIMREQGFEGIIIALTAHLSDEERDETIRCGINSALLKPVDKAALKQIISFHLHGGETEEEVSRQVAEGIFDEQLALQRANHRADLAAELLQILVESLPEDQENMNSSYTDNDIDEFRRQVHKIHGALRYCGVPRLGQAIETLEDEVKKAQSLEVDEIKQALGVANSEINALGSWYRNTTSPFESTVSPAKH